MGITDVLVLLMVTIGPTKAAAMFVGLTAGADPALKRKIAIRAALTAAIVCSAFVLLGETMLGLFHISIPALLIAGGIILFVFALHLVLGDDEAKGDVGPGQPPSIDIATYPLAVPLMASPQGLVAIVVVSSALEGAIGPLILLTLVLSVMAFNLIFLLSADRILAHVPIAVMKVVMRIFGVLLCGLAVQLVILGLQRLGVLPADVPVH